METDDAAAKLRIINDAIKEVRRRSCCEKGRSINDMIKEVRRSRNPPVSAVTRMLQVNDGLAGVDPWKLPRFFAMSSSSSSSRRTHSGYWQEKQDDFTAIRSPGDGSSSSSSGSPSYQGVKRTLDFYLNDGTKTDWIIHDYHVLAPDKDDKSAMFLQEDVVIRKVFQEKHKDPPNISSTVAMLETVCNLIEKYDQLLLHLGLGDDMMDKQLNANLVAKKLLLGSMNLLHRSLFVYLRLFEGHARGSEAGSVYREASTAPYGESEVWQHFTRIKTKDPGVVYAACHRCDQVLKAHPKNGTSHLKRHRETCSCNSNPPTADDQEILRDLRATIDRYNQEKMEGRLDTLELNTDIPKLDPWDLQASPCYVTSSLSLETHQGRWKEIGKERTAICISRLPVPRYVGLKRTLKFHLHNGTKMDWMMLEYHQVDEYMPLDLLLEGTMVFRKVFQIYEDAVKELEKMWNQDDDEEEFYDGGRKEEVNAFMSTLLHDCLLGESVQGGQSKPGKRKRSEIWLHFTKIYTTDPDRVYAVCHCCDKGYEGRSKNGTSHLKRHNKTCSSKHRKL